MFYAIKQRLCRNVENGAAAPIGCWSLPRSACAMRGWPDGNVYDQPGYRENLSARNVGCAVPEARRSGWVAGCGAGAVRQSAALRKHQATIDYDWPDTDHYRWVATASDGIVKLGRGGGRLMQNENARPQAGDSAGSTQSFVRLMGDNTLGIRRQHSIVDGLTIVL